MTSGGKSTLSDIPTLISEHGYPIPWAQAIVCILDLTKKKPAVTAEPSIVRIPRKDFTWLRRTMFSFGGIVYTCNIPDFSMSILDASSEVDKPAIAMNGYSHHLR